MTTLALQSLNFSTKILEKIWRFFKKTLEGIFIGWMLARQAQANAYIAKQLIIEYPEMTVAQLEHQLNQKTIAGINKEFGRD